MQYKGSLIFIFAFFILLINTNGEENKNSTETVLIQKNFGSYMVPGNFIEDKKHSRGMKFFYIKKGEEDIGFVNNISINEGSDPYTLKDHPNFKNAIMRHLVMQIKNKDVQLTGSGSFTKNNYVLYTFKITDKEFITTQFYIVGDYHFILIHETVKGDSPETDSAAQTMVDSFVWPDGEKSLP